MSDKTNPDTTHPSAAPLDATVNADYGNRPKAAAPQLATVDMGPCGAVAVTRPNVPRIFRFLLALTGVRI